MNLKEIIEAAEEKAGGRKPLAQLLDQDAQNLTNAKAGKRGLPAYACIEMAALIGIDPLEAIAASELVTEKKENRRAVFLPFVAETKMARHSEPSSSLVGRARLELATNGLKVRCSTD